MNLEVVFLGTGASIPTRERSLPCTALRRGSDITLLDCGEGSQRQLMASPLSFMKVERIAVSHLHGDHVLGIPGLLQTMGLSGRERPISIIGPEGLPEAVEGMLELCRGGLPFPLDIVVMRDGDVIDAPGLRLRALEALHEPESLSYVIREDDRPGRLDRDALLRMGVPEGPVFSRLQRGEAVEWEGAILDPGELRGPPRPGRSVAYSGDTLPNERLSEAAKGVDLMIHEATFADAEEELARAHGHSTASQAAAVARSAGAGMLALTHISSRYRDADRLLEEASAIFPGCIVARDMMSIPLPLR